MRFFGPIRGLLLLVGALCLLAPSVRGQAPGLKLQLKDLAPAWNLQPAFPPPEAEEPKGFTLNEEVLKRYGFTLKQYQDMSPSDQRRVEEWIKAMEAGRAAAKARPKGVRVGAPAERKWTPGELKAIEKLKQGAAFDKSARANGAGSAPSSAWDSNIKLQNGDFRRFSLRNKDHDFELEFGDLGAGSVSPLIGQSPYVNLTKGGQGYGSFLDYGYKAQGAIVRERARLAYPDNPGLDARLDRRLDSAAGAAGELPLPPGAVEGLRGQTAVPTGYQEEQLLVGSAYGHFGRAYHLIDRVDLGWSVMGLARVTGFFPNAVVDQSAGARVKVSKDHSVGLFGGLTEGVGLFAKSVVQDTISEGGHVPLSPRMDKAPHASVAAWGKMPYLSSVQYSAEAGRQWNPWTTVETVGGSLSTKVGSGRLGVRGALSSESGLEIEFGRRKTAGGVVYSPREGLEFSADYGHDNARLGNAEVDRRSVMLGVTLNDRAKPGATVKLETLFDGQDRLILPATEAGELTKLLNDELAKLIALKDSTEAVWGPEAETRWAEAQDRWASLDPATRQQYNDAYREYVPAGPSLDQLMGSELSDLDRVAKLARMLTDVELLDRLMTRMLRAQVVKNLENVEVPLFGQRIRMTAPNVLAAAHAYSLSLTPIPGITARDAREGLDPALMKRISDGLGCGGKGAQAVSDCLLDKLPAADREALRKAHGADLAKLLQESVRFTSDIIRREINALILQVFLAAERFNELTVDQGRRIGELNQEAIKRYFANLDERDARTRGDLLKAFQRRAAEDLKAQDEAIKRTLSNYGKERLAWLQGQPAWPENVMIGVRPSDWPALLAVYGDKGLFDVILRAKARLAETSAGRPARLLIELSDDSVLGGMMVIRGDPTVLSLPTRPPKGRSFDIPL